jgi:hypothetical protein
MCLVNCSSNCLRNRIECLEKQKIDIFDQLQRDHLAFENTLTETDVQHDLEQEQAYNMYQDL